MINNGTRRRSACRRRNRRSKQLSWAITYAQAERTFRRTKAARGHRAGPRQLPFDPARRRAHGELDTRVGEEIMALFARLHGQKNTIILVTHEREIAEHADRIIRLRDGKVESDEVLRS